MIHHIFTNIALITNTEKLRELVLRLTKRKTDAGYKHATAGEKSGKMMCTFIDDE